MTKKQKQELLEQVDDFLTHMEDNLYGLDEEECIKARKALNEVLDAIENEKIKKNTK